jgi:hypothetical protein
MVFDATGKMVADVTNWMLSKEQCEATADLLIEARARAAREASERQEAGDGT